MRALEEQQTQALLAGLPFYAVLIDRARTYVWVNRLDPTLKADAVIGRKVDEYLPEHEHTRVFDVIERAFSTGQPQGYEAVGYDAGTYDKTFRTLIVPVDGDQAVLLTTDITEQRQTEDQLSETQALLEMVAAHHPDFVAVIDHEQRLTYLNKDPKEGVSRHSVIGLTVGELMVPEDRLRIRATVQRTLDTGEPGSYLARSLLTQRLFDSRVVRLPNGGGALVTSSDMSEREAMAERQRVLEARLSQAQRIEAVGLLAGGVAHDFNNLLQVIGGHLTFASDGLSESHPAQRELRVAQEAVARAGRLTRRLLAFSRSQPMRIQPVDLPQVIDRASIILQRMLPPEVETHLSVPPTPLTVRADIGQLEQVLINLVVNARDAMPNGGRLDVLVRLALPEDLAQLSGSRQDAWVALVVRDTGTGIDPEVLPRIFEPFYTSKEGAGTGLGLATVHGIVSQHGGQVHVDSSPGAGSVFTVLLPLHHAPAKPVPFVESSVTRSAAPWQPCHVLVAEDEPRIRSVIVRLLTDAGYTVTEAENGRVAVEEARLLAPDLVVLDVRMPELEGPDAYVQMLQTLPELPAVFCTGHGPDVAARFGESERVAILAKPFGSAELLSQVRSLLEHARATPL